MMTTFSRVRSFRVRTIGLCVLALCLLLAAGMLWTVDTHTAYAQSLLGIAAQTCAESGTCNGSDPMASGCAADVRTLMDQPVLLRGRQIGFVDLRASQRCNSHWLRAVAYANSGISRLQATIELAQDTFWAAGATKTDIRSLQEADGSVQIFTDMSILPPSTTPRASSVEFDLVDGTIIRIVV